MNYKYGIEVAHTSLFFLATNETINKRLAQALEYLGVLKSKDASKENITKLRSLEKDYLNLITMPYNPNQYSAMAEDFIVLCTDIIKDNETAMQRMQPGG